VSAEERAFVLLKPDAVERGLVGEILRRIEARGFRLRFLCMRVATPEVVAQHYAEKLEKPYYPGIARFITSGPVVTAIVEGTRVVESLRAMLGATDPALAEPGTIRGDLSRDWGPGPIRNLIHCSDSPESAEREIGIWFPEGARVDEAG